MPKGYNRADHPEMYADEPEKGTSKPRKKRGTVHKVLNGLAFQIALDVPEGGAVVKLRSNRKRALGTLGLTAEGLTFVKANGKKLTDRKVIGYDRLARLLEFGIA